MFLRKCHIRIICFTMSQSSTLDDLLSSHRKEKKELIAKTQKMKHSVPKGDKKMKQEVTTEIAQLLTNLDLKHEKEIKEFEFHGVPDVAISSNSLTESKDSYSESVNKDHDAVIKKEENKNDVAPRISKAQKRRDKKAAMEKERNQAIAEQELENLNSQRHIESQGINKKLSERLMTIHEVPSDGDCLYKAVEHQLSSFNVQTSVKSLRESTSKHMLSHKEDYIPFLTSPETGDVLTEEQYTKYCEDIANTSAWGGHIEIQALSNVSGMPIEIIQAEGPSVIAGDENSNPKLILSYHRHIYGLGEHYNSVVPITQ